MGLRIPQDLSVVGFDNIMESKYMGLTTVDQFISEMGFVATQMLIKLINGEPLETQTYKMQTQLVVRTSCQALVENPSRTPERQRHTGQKTNKTSRKAVSALSVCQNTFQVRHRPQGRRVTTGIKNCRPSLRP
jgi:hypothetical protein